MTIGAPISSVNHTVMLQAAVEDVVVKGRVHVVISMMERLARDPTLSGGVAAAAAGVE
jgi:hypothetical protein